MKEKHPCVYILASKRNGTLYTGVTSDLAQRIYLHKSSLFKGFTQKYDVHMLVYFKHHPSMEEAIAREKQIKKWRRRWKIDLIKGKNFEWRDLYDEIL